MFTLFRSSRPKRSGPRLRTRLSLEQLDFRAAPSSLDSSDLDLLSTDDSTDTTALAVLTSPTSTGSTGSSSSVVSAVAATATSATTTTTNATQPVAPVLPAATQTGASPTPPVINNFGAVLEASGWYTFSGKVTDANPGGLTVNFGGIPSLEGMTTTTAADGTFSKLIQLKTDGTDSGMATAQTTDSAGLVSNIAQFDVSPI